MSAPRAILFVHQNFPGQFPGMAAALLARGDTVKAIAAAAAPGMAGVDVRRWSLDRGTTPSGFPHATRAEADLLRGAAAARVAAELRAEGFVPDVIVGNPGWGETIHLKEVWPTAKLILLGEYWYTSDRGDAGFDPEFPVEGPAIEEAMRLNALNAGHALAYTLADRIVVPTPYQASTFPASLQARITVHHEGIDVARATRRRGLRIGLPGGKTIDERTPLVTFVNRTLEPLRGFHIFMRALPAVLAEVPDAEIAIVGSDGKRGYGAAAPDDMTWKAWMLRELEGRLDLSRVHFLDRVAHDQLIALFSLSKAHVYLTYPFVLSWSLLEAMACECLVVGSDTAPVRDVIRAGENGLLVDFFDVDRLGKAIAGALCATVTYAPFRRSARETLIARYDKAAVGLPGWLRLIGETA